MNLTELQKERDVWVARNFPGDTPHNSLLGAVEELGEIAHHVLKLQQGIRGSDEHHLEEIEDGVADCVIFLAGLATHYGFDFGRAVEQTWAKVKQRDWVNFPTNGVNA